MKENDLPAENQTDQPDQPFELLDGDWYQYPKYYDLAFQEETYFDVEFIESAFERFLGNNNSFDRRILEPACGSGRILVELAKNGWELHGYDLSEHMVEFTKLQLNKAKTSANVFQGNMLDRHDVPPVSLAYNLYNTFRHLLTEQDALTHLQNVYESLVPEGVFLLGLHVFPPDADVDDCDEFWVSTKDDVWTRVDLSVINYNEDLRQEQLRFDLSVIEGDQHFCVRSEYPLRTYSLDEMLSLLDSIPEFRLEAVYDFNYELDNPLELSDDLEDTLFVLRKQ